MFCELCTESVPFRNLHEFLTPDLPSWCFKWQQLGSILSLVDHLDDSSLVTQQSEFLQQVRFGQKAYFCRAGTKASDRVSLVCIAESYIDEGLPKSQAV
jgi:hypothetical protein